jgi:hypothetical protein
VNVEKILTCLVASIQILVEEIKDGQLDFNGEKDNKVNKENEQEIERWMAIFRAHNFV